MMHIHPYINDTYIKYIGIKGDWKICTKDKDNIKLLRNKCKLPVYMTTA